MSYHPRIETDRYANFLTTRTRNSELWFANNNTLEEKILGYAAKYAQRYSVRLYALAIEGNHIQATAHFPKPNRADFMRDLNSSVARAVSRHVSQYPGGHLWGRRYSNEFLPGNEDVERQFIYTVLQPVQDGLVEKLSDYPFYNCLNDALRGIKRSFKVVRWMEYRATRRWNKEAKVKDFIEVVSLEYSRLPGYEHLSQAEYARVIRAKVEEQRLKIVAKRKAAGLGFAGRAALLRKRIGSLPFSTKVSDITSHRPRSLSKSKERRDECNAWYFKIYFWHQDASRRYRAGEVDVEFPPGTYKPHLPTANSPPKVESPPAI